MITSDVDRATDDLRWYWQEAEGLLGKRSSQASIQRALETGGFQHGSKAPMGFDERATNAATRHKGIYRRLMALSAHHRRVLACAFLSRDVSGLGAYGQYPGTLWATDAALLAYQVEAGTTNVAHFRGFLAGIATRANEGSRKAKREAQAQLNLLKDAAQEALRDALGTYIGTRLPKPRKVTVAALAAREGISTAAMHKRLQRGKISREKRGKHALVTVEDDE